MKNKSLLQKYKYYGSLFKKALKGDVDMDYTKGSIGTAAFLLAVPMVMEMALESVFAVTDIFFVASLGAEAVSIVGLTEAVITLLYAVAIGICMAVTAMVSRRIGEKNKDAASVVAGQALWMSAVIAILVGIFGVHYAKDILLLMGASNEIAESGKGYTSIMLGGSFTILFLFLNNAIFRGAGDATVAMKSLWLANGINIVLDPLLIYGVWIFPEMGVEGAAIATNIGRGIGVLYQLYHLLSYQNRLNLQFHHFKIVKSIVMRILKLSAGGIGQFLIATASWVILVKIVSGYGSAAVAGYTIAIRVIMFAILPAWGMSNAVSTLVGQNLGAGLPERAEQSVWKVAKINVAFMLLIAVIFVAFADPIIAIFIDDPVTIAYGVDCLRFVSYGYGFYALGMIVIQAFNGAGDTTTPTVINFFCYWMCQIPLAYYLAHSFELGATGVFVAITLAESLIAVVGVMVFRRGKWKLIKV